MALTTTGIILWSLAIGLLLFGLLRKSKGDETDNHHQKHETVRKQHKGGCCG
jgi:hypothetical protein